MCCFETTFFFLIVEVCREKHVPKGIEQVCIEVHVQTLAISKRQAYQMRANTCSVEKPAHAANKGFENAVEHGLSGIL